MPDRRFKPRTRKSGFRDASLIIVATEGTKTEKQYLEALASDEKYRNPKVHVEVLERDGTASSPEHVLDTMNQFKQKYSLSDYDELWLVVDVDRWTEQMLSGVASQCQQKGYKLAVSNPCFEIWLLLHRKNINDYTTDDRAELKANRVTGGRTRLENELRTICGSYDKVKLKTEDFISFVELAIERARALDTVQEHRWPNELGTRVYLLAERIIKKPETS